MSHLNDPKDLLINISVLWGRSITEAFSESANSSDPTRLFSLAKQNADKPSCWGQLAREGHAVVQFKDVERNKFIAVALDGQVKEYGADTRGICGAGRLRLQPIVFGNQWRGPTG